MRKLARRVLAVALVTVMCVSGCSVSGKNSESASEEFEPLLDTEAEATVKIIAGLSNFEALEAVINDFNEYYPNVSVEYSCLDNYKSNIEARLISDSSVGIFMMQAGMYDSDFYFESSINLADEMDFSAIKDEAISSATVDGEVHWLPLALNSSGMAVNTTLLEENGLDMPTNYEEFLNCCKVLKEKGYTPIQGGNYDYNIFNEMVKSMVYTSIMKSYETEDSIVDSLENSEGVCAEDVEEAYTVVKELIDEGYIDIELCESYEDSYNDVIMNFFEGDVAFMLMTNETFSGTKKRETKSEAYSADPFEYVFSYMPFGEDDGYSFIENWIGFAVNENCDEKEWAIEFMRFLATTDELNQLASIKGMPSVAKETEDERFSIYTENSENTAYSSAYVPDAVGEAIVNGAISLKEESRTVEDAMNVMREYLKTHLE